MGSMVESRTTDRFARWLDNCAISEGERGFGGSHRTAGGGESGDVAPVGEGVSELRIDAGPDTASTSHNGGAP